MNEEDRVSFPQEDGKVAAGEGLAEILLIFRQIDFGAVRKDKDLLLPSGDMEEPFFIEAAQIPGVKNAVL